MFHIHNLRFLKRFSEPFSYEKKKTCKNEKNQITSQLVYSPKLKRYREKKGREERKKGKRNYLEMKGKRDELGEPPPMYHHLHLGTKY